MADQKYQKHENKTNNLNGNTNNSSKHNNNNKSNNLVENNNKNSYENNHLCGNSCTCTYDLRLHIAGSINTRVLNQLMCTRTQCFQLHKLPQNHCGDNQEITLFLYIHIKYAHLASVEFEDSRTPITAYIKHLAWFVEHCWNIGTSTV